MKITTGKIHGAQRIVIYGVEGIGKSTFASHFPDPLFIDTEGSTRHLDVARFDAPKSWTMLLKQVDYVLSARPCKTLVIDTMDWAEKLCIAHILQTVPTRNSGRAKGIEDYGYGQGYTWVAEEMGRLLNRLSDVVDAGIHVVLTAHATIKKFEPPHDSTAYDRYELKMGNKTSPLVKEWADMLLFANYDVYVVKTDTGKGKGHNGERVLFTSHRPAWDAKNRHELPEKLPLTYKAIAQIIERQEVSGPVIATAEEVKPPTPASQVPPPAPPAEPAPSLQPGALAQLLEAEGATVEQFLHSITDEQKGGRGIFAVGTPYSDLPDDFLEFVAENWTKDFLPYLKAVMAQDNQLSAPITDGTELGSLQDQ